MTPRALPHGTRAALAYFAVLAWFIAVTGPYPTSASFREWASACPLRKLRFDWTRCKQTSNKTSNCSGPRQLRLPAWEDDSARGTCKYQEDCWIFPMRRLESPDGFLARHVPIQPLARSRRLFRCRADPKSWPSPVRGSTAADSLLTPG